MLIYPVDSKEYQASAGSRHLYLGTGKPYERIHGIIGGTNCWTYKPYLDGHGSKRKVLGTTGFVCFPFSKPSFFGYPVFLTHSRMVFMFQRWGLEALRSSASDSEAKDQLYMLECLGCCGSSVVRSKLLQSPFLL